MPEPLITLSAPGVYTDTISFARIALLSSEARAHAHPGEKMKKRKFLELFQPFFTHERVETCLSGELPLCGRFIGLVLKEESGVANWAALGLSPPSGPGLLGSDTRTRNRHCRLGKGFPGALSLFYDGSENVHPDRISCEGSHGACI